jgi:hypothetical protein
MSTIFEQMKQLTVLRKGVAARWAQANRNGFRRRDPRQTLLDAPGQAAPEWAWCHRAAAAKQRGRGEGRRGEGAFGRWPAAHQDHRLPLERLRPIQICAVLGRASPASTWPDSAAVFGNHR